MLKKMIIKNFKCFKKETILDLRKTNYKLLEQNTYGKVLKGALFVGDNASGKTTMLAPIKLLLDLLFKDRDIHLFLNQCLFSDEKITKLSYIFDIDGHEINYSFSFENNVFVEETLFVDKESIIEREGKHASLHLLKNKETFNDVDTSLLFLKRVYFNTKFSGNENLIKWFEFMKKSIYINVFSRQISAYNGERLTAVNYVEKYGVECMNDFFKINNFQYSVQYAQTIEKKGIRYEASEDEGKRIFFEREGMGIPIPDFLESMGNQTLINILPAILLAVERGGMLILDEFSSGLHNKLEELLVKYIMKQGGKIQLFFVSHSTNLLSNSILRPDQIFAVEMDGKEGSKLYRFSNEQPRIAQNIEKMYLSGIFGGVPEYGNDNE